MGKNPRSGRARAAAPLKTRQGQRRLEQSVGDTIRRLRTSSGLSVRTLADKCGFSASFISQVELGQASPSISSLDRLASGLGVTLGQFFPDSEPTAPALIRASNRPTLQSRWSRTQIEGAGASRFGSKLEALFITLRPGGSSGSRLHANETELFVVVFSGKLQLELLGSVQVLQRGDAITIPPGTAHRWDNKSSKPAQLLKVIARLVS